MRSILAWAPEGCNATKGLCYRGDSRVPPSPSLARPARDALQRATWRLRREKGRRSRIGEQSRLRVEHFAGTRLRTVGGQQVEQIIGERRDRLVDDEAFRPAFEPVRHLP